MSKKRNKRKQLRYWKLKKGKKKRKGTYWDYRESKLRIIKLEEELIKGKFDELVQISKILQKKFKICY